MSNSLWNTLDCGRNFRQESQRYSANGENNLLLEKMTNSIRSYHFAICFERFENRNEF